MSVLTFSVSNNRYRQVCSSRCIKKRVFIEIMLGHNFGFGFRSFHAIAFSYANIVSTWVLQQKPSINYKFFKKKINLSFAALLNSIDLSINIMSIQYNYLHLKFF